MMFSGQDDDDLDFNPAASSKLASLFGLGKAPDKGNASLTYTAPKQPRQRSSHDNSSSGSGASNQGTPSSANKLTLIVVKAVHSFKLEDGNYNAQGKLGAAVLGNSTSRMFQLLLYKGKQQQITVARITSQFQYTVQPNLYASFYDDRMLNWSLVFENADDAVDFARQIAVARYRSAAEEVAISQELSPGGGPLVSGGSTIHLQVSSQAFTVDTVQAVQHNMKAVIEIDEKVSDSGWSSGLLGASEGSCRLLLLPVTVPIPWITYKRDGPVLIETTIEAIRGDPESEKTTVLDSKKSTPAISGPDSAVESSAEDSSIRARGASIKEALTHSPRSNKANIISRMARMGQATLPLKGAIACNPSDSEETEDDVGLQEPSKPLLKARPSKLRSNTSSRHQPSSVAAGLIANPQSATSASITSSASPVTVIQTPPVWAQQNILRTGPDGSLVQYIAGEGQLVAMGSAGPPQQLQLVTSPVHSPDQSSHIAVFLSEVRTQNSEVRMNIGKVSDKVDQLMAKMDSLSVSGSLHSHTPLAGVGMEPATILSSIEKLVKDNQNMKAEVAEKNKRLDEQNERIYSLLSANSKFLEQSSSLLEQKHQQQQLQKEQEKTQQENEMQLQQMRMAQEEKNKLANQLADTQTQLVNLQGLVQTLQQTNSELVQKIETVTVQLKEKERNLAEAEHKAESQSSDEVEKLASCLKEQEKNVADLQQQIERDRDAHKFELAQSTENLQRLTLSHQEEVFQLSRQLLDQKASASHHLETVNKLQAECIGLQTKLESSAVLKVETTSTSGISINQFVVDVKSLMNTLYRGLNQQFASGQNYDGSLIRSIVASTIKDETLRFVEQIESQQAKETVPNVNSRNASLPSSQEDSGSVTRSAPIASASSVSSSHQETIAESFGSAKTNTSAVSAVTQQSTENSAPSAATSTAPPVPEFISAPTAATVSGTAPDIVPVSSSATPPGLDAPKEERESSLERSWRPQPPPPPFDDEDDSDDWLA